MGAAGSATGTYRGTLSANDFAIGWHLCFINARSLVSDALILHAAARHERSTLLSLLAVEEAAKPALLLNIFLARNHHRERRDAWLKFRQHDPKAAWHWQMLLRRQDAPELTAEGAPSAEELARFASITRLGVSYVDRLHGRLKWSAPWDVATSDFSATVLTGAVMFVSRSWVSLREIHQMIPSFAAGVPSLVGWPMLANQLGCWLATPDGAAATDAEQAAHSQWFATVRSALPRRPDSAK